MPDQIDSKYDRVYSIEGTEWHGKAIHVDAIGDREFDSLSHEIKEVELNPVIDGVEVKFPNHKLLVADLTHSRPEMDTSERFVPLHVPKSKYSVIDNREVIECMKKSFKDLDVKITTAGTLETLKKFFVSVDIGNSEMIINKDKFCAYVNFVTSHDGTVSMHAYDSLLRIVCKNTFIASREASGKAGFKVYHTKNSDIAMEGLAELFNAILKGRVELKEVMEFLASWKCDANDALAFASGYFCLETGKDEIATRSYNNATEIVSLFSNGIGNRGETLYDLANGATEFWTHGNGVGRSGNVSEGQKAYRSSFGTASSHKEKFIAMLSNENRRAKALEVGREAVAKYLEKSNY